MPIAGQVFPEWYWAPILVLIFLSPLILGGAALLYAVAARVARRRGLRPRTRARIQMALEPVDAGDVDFKR